MQNFGLYSSTYHFLLLGESDLSNGYLETPIDWIPGLQKMRLKDLSTFIPTTDPNDVVLNFMKDESEEAHRATAIILNNFDPLEAVVLQAIQAIAPPIYTIGPMHLLCGQIPDNSPLNFIGSNLWKQEANCLEWLNGRKKGSVLYVSFGSLAVLTNEQLVEIATGLANSGHDFLMVIRRDILKNDGSYFMLEDFLIQTSGRGLLTSWCPQEEVLTHPSVGGFFTHCGWNSMLEGISAGVPMICWPQAVDQATNCRLACTQWGIGIEIGNVLKRDVVEKAVRVLMEGEMGKEMREKVSEWKRCAIEATESGGRSVLNLQRLIEDVLLNNKKCI